jgi:hypothetical protein
MGIKKMGMFTFLFPGNVPGQVLKLFSHESEVNVD